MTKCDHVDASRRRKASELVFYEKKQIRISHLFITEKFIRKQRVLTGNKLELEYC